MFHEYVKNRRIPLAYMDFDEYHGCKGALGIKERVGIFKHHERSLAKSQVLVKSLGKQV